MCELTTIATIGSAVMSAYGSYQESKAQKQQAEYQAAVARNNQIIADRNAKEIEKRGEIEANRYRAQVRQKMADQMVGLAGQGVDVTTGTSIDLLADSAELGELDAQTIRSNASREAYNQRVAGMNYGAQAGLYQSQADNQSPLMSGVSSLLSGAGTVADRWNKRPVTQDTTVLKSGETIYWN